MSAGSFFRLPRRCAVAAACVLMASPRPSSADSNGTTAAEFLRFGAGQPSGMMGASGSVVRDATAIYWNPAGLAALQGPDAYFSHSMLVETMQNDFLGVAVPAFKDTFPSVLGYSAQVLSQSSIDKIDNAGNSVGSFSALDMAHTLTLASQWRETRAGVSVRWIQESIDGTQGRSVAAGFGVQQDFGKAFSAGFSLDNVGPNLQLGSESFPLPTTARAGGSFLTLGDDLLLASDVSLARGQDVRWHMGASYRVFPPSAPGAKKAGPSVSVRFGYAAGKSDSDGPPGFAAGIGLEARSFRTDFSFQPFGAFGDVFQLGVGYRFDGGSPTSAEGPLAVIPGHEKPKVPPSEPGDEAPGRHDGPRISQETIFSQADRLILAGRYREAQDALMRINERLAERDPQRVQCLDRLARVAFGENRFAEAKELFIAALNAGISVEESGVATGAVADSYRGLGQCLELAGDINRAIKAYQKAIEVGLPPQDRTALIARIRILQSRKE